MNDHLPTLDEEPSGTGGMYVLRLNGVKVRNVHAKDADLLRPVFDLAERGKLVHTGPEIADALERGCVVEIPDDEFSGIAWTTDICDAAWFRCRERFFIARISPRPEPETEKVPWVDAFTADLPIAEWGGQRIKNVQRQSSGMFLSTHGLYPVIRVDFDGMVTVLREGGEK